jgi:hypothetical protein
MQVNVHLIRNRGNYQELMARLGIALVKKQEGCAERFIERRVRWRALRHKYTVEQFLKTVNSQEIQMPKARRELVQSRVYTFLMQHCTHLILSLV